MKHPELQAKLQAKLANKIHEFLCQTWAQIQNFESELRKADVIYKEAKNLQIKPEDMRLLTQASTNKPSAFTIMKNVEKISNLLHAHLNSIKDSFSKLQDKKSSDKISDTESFKESFFISPIVKQTITNCLLLSGIHMNEQII